MMDSGISTGPAVCSTRNMIWALEAVSLSGFSSCKLCIAFSPNGVAALSRPSILAEKLIIICPLAGWFGGTSGNSRVKNGPMMRDSSRIAPAFSPMLRMPRKNVMMPASGRAISMMAILAVSNVPSMMVLKTSVSPRKMSLNSATAKAMRKKAIQT